MKKNKLFQTIKSSILQDLKFIALVILLLEILYGIYKTEEIRKISKILSISSIKSVADIIDNLKLDLYTNYFLQTIFIFSFTYLFIKLVQNLISNSKKILNKNIILTILLYSAIFIFISGVFIYKQSKDLISPTIIFILTISFIKLIMIIYWEYDNQNNLNKKGFLISDGSLENFDDDKLGFRNKAKDFSEIIYNNGDYRGLVFGLVAPWGSGKTTFLNFLQKQEIINDNCLVFKFNPWYFENEGMLLEKFIIELKNFLLNESNIYLNELGNDLNILVKILGRKTNNLLGLDIDWGNNKDLYTTKESINNSLKEIDKKIIIVIDDLDRITSDKLRSIFKIINLCKDFYNTNFVLCYDLSNFNNIDENLKTYKKSNGDGVYLDITNEEFDNTNLVKFIEKIVNVQFSLYPDFDKLKKYFREIFIKSKLNFSEKSKEGIKNGIDKLFNIKNYRIWGKHISDIRSIKRIYNNIVATFRLNNGDGDYVRNIFDIDEGLFFDSFIKLKLLSLLNNNLYSDIYNEVYLAQAKQELFISIKENKYLLNSEYDSGGILYYSSPKLKEYIKTLSLKEKEMVENIFPLVEKNDKNGKGQKIEISSRDIRIGDNLKNYFDLIEINKLAGFNRYIKDYVHIFINKSSDIILIMNDIKLKYNEKGIINFLTVIEVEISNLKSEKVDLIIDYIINEFYKYSINSLANCWDNIARILDGLVGQENTKNNCISVVGGHLYTKGESIGIIDKFFKADWGIKGLYNVMSMRLLAERSSNLWNFQRGIVGEKYDLNLPKLIYFEKISKYIFNLFKTEYIDKKVNIFKLIDELSDNDFKIDDGINVYWPDTKNGIREFIIYHLTNDKDGIGYYDIDNNLDINSQNHGIKIILNEYYFNNCFIGNDGIRYLIEYIFGFIYLPPFSDKTGINSDDIKIRLFNSDSQDGNIFNVFEEKSLKTYIELNNKNINKFISIKGNDIFEGFNGVKFSYQFGWKIFMGKLNLLTK